MSKTAHSRLAVPDVVIDAFAKEMAALILSSSTKMSSYRLDRLTLGAFATKTFKFGLCCCNSLAAAR